MFCIVVDGIDTFGCPVDFEHILADPVLQPVETHIDCFAAFLFYGAMPSAVLLLVRRGVEG